MRNIPRRKSTCPVTGLCRSRSGIDGQAGGTPHHLVHTGQLRAEAYEDHQDELELDGPAGEALKEDRSGKPTMITKFEQAGRQGTTG